MPQWNTEDYKAAEQFGFWREVLCEAFIALNSTREFAGGFRGHVIANRVDDINVCRLVTDEHNILRTQHEISRMPRDCFFVNMQIDGDVHVQHIGKETHIRPNQFYVVDAAEPYELAYRRPGGNVRTFSFRIPKTVLAPLLSNAEEAMGVRVSRDTAMGALAVDFLKNIAVQSDAIPAAAQPTMARMAADLIALSRARIRIIPRRSHNRNGKRSSIRFLLTLIGTTPRLSSTLIRFADALASRRALCIACLRRKGLLSRAK